jgi:hypothetical protein
MSWHVIKGREWSSERRRTSLLGRTILWTEGMARRGLSIRTSHWRKNMKIRRRREILGFL